jgi:hypothetical protein
LAGNTPKVSYNFTQKFKTTKITNNLHNENTYLIVFNEVYINPRTTAIHPDL